MTTVQMKDWIKSGKADDILLDIYLDREQLNYQRVRYINAIQRFETIYGESEASVFSAPGRSEIGGNHTDHQNGEVLAAAINLDAIAIATWAETPYVRVVSGDYQMIEIDLQDLEKNETEEGSTSALIKGVLSGILNQGGKIGGFYAYITSDVLIGSGLSSSAAFEVLIGNIISGLYNDMTLSPVKIAMIGKYAENVYFGKPSGLMDQMASAVGNLVHIDFADKDNPEIETVSCDLGGYGYSLCIADTKGSHADLTGDYAAVPAEMKTVAKLFGKEVLRGVTLEELMEKCSEIRENAGDRAFLRAVHFMKENIRVCEEVEALKAGDFLGFLKVVKASGDSSFKFLQNVYTSHSIKEQNVSVALAVSESVLGVNGVCRVHGGGFAGTIQAFVKNEVVREYKEAMETIFGSDSCKVLKIRKYGGMRVL